ncbi:MAG: ATP-binding protein [Deltaproteobacteria bacterium]|nr:ATP-binding protein [Deltaproteobacteria bacterium]MBT4266473.1 ATP-binding protein [Deltaproteobacteria bacterium]MBT4644151.1 ATP-binding protein [Deltaproteobacteria bacterium]MBT6502791.1 ATP-binding protein [Deltaproteobacteria bacterium]MBT6611392.1 ATP-binding protein [Deltaproteobacteria bacterium]
MIQDRYNLSEINDDLQKKMVFLSGPRQVGKTTFGLDLLEQNGLKKNQRYLNWDIARDREFIIKEQFPAGSGLLVLDEIHKYTRWRQVVKGLFDGRKEELQILITGSARLDHYRHGGDSLQGRYHFHRMHPLSFAELKAESNSDLNDLLNYSGFPEPFFSGSNKETKRWSREYRSRLIREDLQDLERVKDLALIETLALRLPDLVGSPLSINSLRGDLQVSHKTVDRWIGILENLYLIFRIYPFGAPKIRAVKKEAKHYHFNWSDIKNPGARLENLVACHLLKYCHYLEDTQGREMELRFFRDIDLREVDFVLMEDTKPIHFIEVKTTERKTNKALRYLKLRFPDTKATQIALDSNDDYIDKDGIRHQSITGLLSSLI